MATGTKALAEKGHHFTFQTILSHPEKSSRLGVILIQPLWGMLTYTSTCTHSHAYAYLQAHTTMKNNHVRQWGEEQRHAYAVSYLGDGIDGGTRLQQQLHDADVILLAGDV